MNKTAILPCAFLLLVSAAPAQEIFDLVRKGDVPAVRALVEKSPDVLKAKLPNGSTPLHVAATADMKEMSALFLEKGAALEARDDYGRTPLVVCARERGQVETGKLLIDAGADVNAADKFGSTALELAAWRGKADFIDLLLAKGAKIPTEGRNLSLFLSMSASQGLTALFDRIIAAGGDLKTAAAENPGLLHAAAAGGSAKIIAALLDLGLNPAEPDRFGWTPFHYAARDGRTEAIQTLIGRKAFLDARTIMGQTAYNVAVERKMNGAAALLAEKGADRSGLRFPVLEGDYLGQKPPAGGAELFSLGIISSIWGLHSTAVFSPDGNEVLWAAMIDVPGALYSEGGLLMMKRVDGRWTAPAWAPFSDPKTRDDVPFYSLDGKRITFISARPLPNGAGEKERIWYVDRTDAGWSEARPLDPALNDHPMHWSFSLDKSGNLYFSGQGADSRGMSDIYVSRFADGRHQKPENLGDPICSALPENTPFVAPDGSYLLFSRQYDIWASFRTAGGTWSAPVKLGPEVNSPSVELCPSVTADGKFLFFLSQRDGESHAYWVKADVIEKARPASPVPAADADPAAPASQDPLRGEYLGQKKPALAPELFAPGVVSTEKEELNSVFTPDGDEFYFTVRSAQGAWKIMVMDRKNGAWSIPRVASFSGTYSDVDLFISPDGNKLYFCSNRPLDGKGEPQRSFDIWLAERKGAEWSEPVNLGAPVNSEESEFYPSVTKDGTLYFQSMRPGSRGGRDLYRAKLEGESYRTVEALGAPVNSDLLEGDVLVSPDETFIVFSVNRPGGFGQGDLYASFRARDGSWTEPRNLGGAVNTKANENCPILSPDGKFLFYTGGGDIYWVSSEIIQNLRLK